MYKYLFLVLVSLMHFHVLRGQPAGNLSVSNYTMGSSSDELPFWLRANRDGKVDAKNTFLNLSEIGGTGNYFFRESNGFVKAGATLISGLGNNRHYFQASQLYAGINLKNWELNAGMYYNEEQFDGLSTSNGNMAQSRNARPHPRIGFRTAGFKPVPGMAGFLGFKGEYEEGILNDERYVAKTHLHHKSFYLRLKPAASFDIQAGLEHFVMWGGTSQNENIGKLPAGFGDYWLYITGKRGNEHFPETDRLNVAGNQYGTYQVLITRNFEKFNARLNLSHPFEDRSGLKLRNWPDNILGLYLEMNKPDKFITHFIYEYTNTRQQGIKDSLYRWDAQAQVWHRGEPDGYYTHGIYRSGVIYYRQTMGSPLFSSENSNTGIESTRFFAHHIGLKGTLASDFYWKALATFIQHWGNWGSPFDPKKNQLSASIEFLYQGEKLPFHIGLNIAGDKRKWQQDKLGLQIYIAKIW